MPLTTYELKYCERCGSLLVRRSQSSENYCEPCRQALMHVLFPGNSAPVRWKAGARRRFHKIPMAPGALRLFPAASPANLPAGRVQ